MSDTAGAPGRFLHNLIYEGGWKGRPIFQNPAIQALLLKKYDELSNDIDLGKSDMAGRAFGTGPTLEERWTARHDAKYAPVDDVLPSDRDIAPVDKKTPIDEEPVAPGVKEGLKNSGDPDLISEEELKRSMYDVLGVPQPGEYGRDQEKPEPWAGPKDILLDESLSDLEKGIAIGRLGKGKEWVPGDDGKYISRGKTSYLGFSPDRSGDTYGEGTPGRWQEYDVRDRIIEQAGGKKGGGSFSGGAGSQKGITMDGMPIDQYNARMSAQQKRDWAMNRARDLASRGGVSGRAIDKQEQIALMEMASKQDYNDALAERARAGYRSAQLQNEGANSRALFKARADELVEIKKSAEASAKLWDNDIKSLNDAGARSTALLVSRVARMINLPVKERQHRIDMLLLAEAEKEGSPLDTKTIEAIKRGAGRPNERDGASMFDQAVFGK